MNHHFPAKRQAVLLLLGLLLALSVGAPALAQAILPAGFVDETVIGGLNQPTNFTQLPDGRLLITEKAGLVRVLKNGALLPTPFIDLRNSVNDYWDHGLIGIAADKNFATNGFVYLLFTYENDPVDYSGSKTGRMIRVTASGDVASPSSAVTILGTSVGSSCKNFAAGADCLPSDNPSHSVGNIRVAADGTLWVTHGDGASFNVVDDDALRAQDLNSLAGKLLHITTSGAGISTNPFWNGNAAANRSKIWAYGMRNPYRFALHPTTGMPYLGDVGWGTWEEVNTPVSTTRSLNLGWPCYEGMFHQSGYEPKATCQTLYTSEPTGNLPPAIAYAHNAGSSAVTGGVFYTGTSFPPQYRGAFFYGDYAVGFIRYFQVGSDGLMSGPLFGFAANAGGPVFFDTDGESLLYVAINTGEVRRIRYITPGSGISYLSDRTWTSMSNGVGPIERDQSNGDVNPVDGKVISVRGQNYAKGLGASAPSDVRFALGAACTSFDASIGIDGEVGSAGSVVFQVWLDGVKQYDSGTMLSSTATKSVSLPVTGVNELRLVVTNAGGGSANDHADWANARVTCTGTPDTTAPTVTSVAPLNGSSNASLTGPVTATFSEAMTASTLTTSTFTLVPQGSTTPVAATATYNAATAQASLTPTTSLSGTTTYTATIKGGSSGAKDLSGNALAADKVWSFTTGNAPVSSYLSDRVWLSASNGYGPVEKDQSNGEDLAGDGHTITLNGVTYAKGLGTHALADVRYAVNAACSQFSAVVGLDDEVGSNGSVNFQVWTDGTLRYDSGVMTGSMAGKSVVVDISGVSQLRLVTTDALDGSDYDHADWADVKVLCSATGAFPVPTISQPVSTLKYKVGDVINYAGSAVDVEDGPLPGTSLSWNVLLYHCPGGVCHIHPFLSTTGANGSFTVPDHGDENYFQINLTATDSNSNAATTSMTIQPLTVQLTLATSPTGLQVVYGGTATTAPTTYTTVVGSTHTIFAPSPQGSQNFASWSDGGAQQHNIVIGSTNSTFTAQFTGSDTTPPTVTATTPANNATGVSTATAVTGTFSEAMTASTLTTSTVTLVPQGSTTPVAATVSYNVSTSMVTLTPSAALSSGTTYTARIKGGSAGAKDLAGNALAADVTWVFTTASGAASSYLSDRTWTSATNGYGPVERDRSNGEDLGGDGNVLTLNGVTYAKGLGTHAIADIHYALGAACTAFTAVVGVDDEVGPNGTVVFQVWTDGVQRYDSGTRTGADAGLNVSVDVTGANDLRLLVTDNADGSNYDHADWANAQVTCTTDTTAPTVTTTSPASGATNVAITASVTATFSEAMDASTISTSTVTLVVQSTGTSVPATVTYNATTRVVTLKSTASLANGTTYTAKILSGASGVKDLAGNALAADKVWSFTTIADTTPPTVTATSPANGATGVSVTANETATFSEAMNASTITTTTVFIVKSGTTTPLAAVVTYDSTNRRVTLNPNASLLNATTYVVTVQGGTSGVKDVAGNALAADKTWSFTTQ